MKKQIIPQYEMDFDGNIIYPEVNEGVNEGVKDGVKNKPVITPEDDTFEYLEWNLESNAERCLL